MQEEVRRAAAEGTAVERVVDALASLPDGERVAIARAVFDRLPPGEQWAVVERAFGDEAVSRALADERSTRAALAARRTALRPVIAAARERGVLDADLVPEGAALEVALFRVGDLAAGGRRGVAASTCARRLDLRALGAGTFQVIADVFNPNGGLFVSAAYDAAAWEAERLVPHAQVRLGSAVPVGATGTFQTSVPLGGRLDVETGGEVVEGRLHMGGVMIEAIDIFATPDFPP